MNKTRAILVRCLSAGSLFALVPVVMQFSWMATTHRWMGLGRCWTARPLSTWPRPVSAFHALFGAGSSRPSNLVAQAEEEGSKGSRNLVQGEQSS
jgi:hypothetical protein